MQKTLPPRPIKGKPWAKYPSCFGPLSLRQLCDLARRNGMMIIRGYKPDMHCFNEICLFGTASQMKKTEAEWIAAGHEKKPRNFTAIFGIESNFGCPYEKWVEHEMGHPRKV